MSTQRQAENKRNEKLRKKLSDKFELVKGDVWEITQKIVDTMNGTVTNKTMIIEIMHEPYLGMVSIKRDGIEKNMTVMTVKNGLLINNGRKI